jgi:hypothetical protein
LIIYSFDSKLQTITLFLFSPKPPYPLTIASFKSVRLSPAVSITREPVQRQFHEEPTPLTIRPMANVNRHNQGVSLQLGLTIILVQAMLIWKFQLAFVISIEWRTLSVNSSDEEEEDAEDHHDGDNGLSPEEREYRRQRDEQEALRNTPANRVEVRENNRCRFQERR